MEGKLRGFLPLPSQAFSESLFPFFRDKRGNPLNERGRDGLPLHTPLGDYVSDGTVRYFRHAPWLVADYVKSVVDGMEGPPVHLVRMIITPNVVVSGINMNVVARSHTAPLTQSFTYRQYLVPKVQLCNTITP